MWHAENCDCKNQFKIHLNVILDSIYQRGHVSRSYKINKQLQIIFIYFFYLNNYNI